MKIDKYAIIRTLPEELRKKCLIGICHPGYLDNLPIVYSIKTKKYSAHPQELFPAVQSIIVLIHFTPVANDYSVENIILKSALLLWQKLKVRTHVLDDSNEVDFTRLLGTEWGPAAERYDKLILLKELAYYAGLGQYGRSSLIINPQFGSDVKIQTLFTEEKLKYDSPLVPKIYPGCRDCCQCIELCPGEAIKDYWIEPARCSLWQEDKGTKSKLARPHLCRLARNRRPKAKGYLLDFCCRNCQSFCKVNAGHYLPHPLPG